MFNKHVLEKNEFMLEGAFSQKGYDWWWHSFTGVSEESGEERQFFIEFFVCNPALGEKLPILGQLIENKYAGRRPSYLMVKAGCWGEEHMQLHRFFGIGETAIHKKAPFSIGAGDCYLDETKTFGSISISEREAEAHPEWMCDAGCMEWELSIKKDIAFNVGYGTSALLRKMKAFEMYWHAEGMKTYFEGKVTVNGKKYIVKPENSYGYADKNWGSGFTSPWVWLSSNNMVSRISGERLENSVFDIGGGRPKIYFVPLERKLLGAFYYEGEEFEYNFSKFWMLSGTKFACKETADEIIWHVRQENSNSVMDTKIRCKKKDMLLVNYEEPDGRKRHKRLWNGGNGTGRIKLYRKTKEGLKLIDDIDVFNTGCEYGEFKE